MREHPILFSGPMVRAILEGHKTQTRRLFNPYGTAIFKEKLRLLCLKIGVFEAWKPHIHTGPYGKPGDRLWVRETWGVGTRPDPFEGWVDGIEYRADEEYISDDRDSLHLYDVEPPDNICLDDYSGKGWRPSIHMFRWASRINLEITDIRFERLHDISSADARAEGVEYETADPPFFYVPGYWPHSKTAVETWEGPVGSFKKLWNLINEKRGYGWITNPWVWVVEFKVLSE